MNQKLWYHDESSPFDVINVSWWGVDHRAQAQPMAIRTFAFRDGSRVAQRQTWAAGKSPNYTWSFVDFSGKIHRNGDFPISWGIADFLVIIIYFILNILLFLHWYYTSLIIHLLRKYNRHLWLMIGTLMPSTIYRFFHMWKIEATHFLQRSCRFSWRRFHIPPIDRFDVWNILDLNSLWNMDATAEFKSEVILTSSIESIDIIFIDMSVWLSSEPDSYSGRASISSGLMHSMKAWNQIDRQGILDFLK